MTIFLLLVNVIPEVATLFIAGASAERLPYCLVHLLDVRFLGEENQCINRSAYGATDNRTLCCANRDPSAAARYTARDCTTCSGWPSRRTQAKATSCAEDRPARSSRACTYCSPKLAVSRAGFYAWQRRPPSGRHRRDTQLQVAIAASHRRSHGTYGSPRIHRDLREAGQRVSRKRVARLMGAAGLRGLARRRFRVTTRSAPDHPVAPNHLARQFAPGRAQRVWAADLTYCWTTEGWLYLAVLLDLTSRRVVGWATSARLDRALARTALRRALALHHPAPLHHSDRGSQYTSADYQRLLAACGIVCSMSRRGDCYDNAVVESFFATLKRELLDRRRWATRREVEEAVGQYSDGWYNPERRHSSLGYLSPVAFEQRQGFAA